MDWYRKLKYEQTIINKAFINTDTGTFPNFFYTFLKLSFIITLYKLKTHWNVKYIIIYIKIKSSTILESH